MVGFDRRKFLGAVGAAGAVGVTGMLTGRAAASTERAGCVVYLGSYTTWGQPPGVGLQVATRGSGPALKLGATVPGVPDASWLAVSKDKLYSTNELVPDGQVTTLSAANPPKVLGSQSVGGAGTTHLSVHPSGKFVLTANYTDGTVSVLPIQSGGKAGPPTDVVKHSGGEREAHAHQVVTDPSGKWVVAVDLGTDSVYVYKLDLGTGKLKLNQQLKLPSGAGPRHLVFHPNGKYAYVLGELRAEITVAAWDANAGKLTAGAVVPTVPSTAPVPQYPAEIAISRDGRFVYASNRGEDTIATFGVGAGGAEIKRLGENATTGGAWPRHFTLDPSERWVYVANQRSNTVTWLPRDPATGLLGKPAGSLAVNHIAFVLFR
ncbi:lactonase family protein [Amycolatopsis sp. 195334CR]|uniref:lactonase family protein n=1 Tax=Amycolatopsis sp. 195334CR TaxID=2814588 RepID=UPI001A8F6393|nr:lactonase family protein [Amycolatopsis sp. 195334CR]MBN6038643.1 lactonase family protein [Amycolatopsis sp. 195334CR]